MISGLAKKKEKEYLGMHACMIMNYYMSQGSDGLEALNFKL